MGMGRGSGRSPTQQRGQASALTGSRRAACVAGAQQAMRATTRSSPARLEQHATYGAEDRGGAADAEGQADQRRHREEGGPAQGPPPVAEIVEEW